MELKQAGVAEQVIQGGIAPRAAAQPLVRPDDRLDFEGLGGKATVSTQARKGYLYLIVPDGDKERVFIGNLQAILAGRWQRDALIDNTDLLLPKKVRRVTFASEVPLKTYGRKKALFLLRPNRISTLQPIFPRRTGQGCRSSCSIIQPRRWSASVAFRCSTGRTRCWPTAGT